MIRRSPEIEAIVRRWAAGIHDRPQDTPHYLSQDDALRYVGTAEGEIWQGQLLRDGIAEHLSEVPEFHEKDTFVEAYECGSVGWAFYAGTFMFTDTGTETHHRVTYVFVLENGAWKMVQHHVSNPSSNVEKMGVEHRALNALLAAAQDESPELGVEGLASIMFTDIARSTALAATVGDRVWMRVLADHLAETEKIVTEAGGTLVKSLGDGTMSAFPSARAAMAAARAAQAAIEARPDEPQFAIRIGIHTGEVIGTNDDFFGSVVNKAARIAASARPGETRVSDATRLMVGTAGGFTFSAPLSVELRGFEGPQTLYVLEG